MSEKRSQITEQHHGNTSAKKIQLTKAKLIGLGIGPLVLVTLILLPMPLNWEQQALMAIIAMTVIFWISQPIPIPITAILALTLAVILDVAPALTVFGAFSSPTLFLLIGGFLLTVSMAKYGLGKRIALWVLSIPGVGGSTTRMVIAFGALAAVLSAVIDNGAVASMLVPIAIGLVNALKDAIFERTNVVENREQPLRFATALLLITAYGATVGALLTPFGDATNLVGRHFIETEFGVAITVGQWMTLAVPTVSVLFVILVTAVIFINRPEVDQLSEVKSYVATQRRALGAMSAGERNTAIAFGVAVCLWLLPAVVSVFGERTAELQQLLTARIPPPVVAVLAACSLFVLPIGRREGFTMTWSDTRRMDWGPVLLVGSALALGNLMMETELAQVLGRGLAARVGGLDAMGISFLASSTAIMFSEISTNLVSITVLVPTITPVAEAGGADPLTIALIATFSAIYGFMLPISTSANVIVFGSGQVPIWRMIKTGFVVDISGILVIVLGVTGMLGFAGL